MIAPSKIQSAVSYRYVVIFALISDTDKETTFGRIVEQEDLIKKKEKKTRELRCLSHDEEIEEQEEEDPRFFKVTVEEHSEE